MLRLDENQSGEASMRAAANHKFTAAMICSVCDGGQGSQPVLLHANLRFQPFSKALSFTFPRRVFTVLSLMANGWATIILPPAGPAMMIVSLTKAMTLLHIW